MKRLARRALGFTLIEVMVALVIVAVALSAGIKAAGALADNAQRIVEVTSAQWCADNLLTELWVEHKVFQMPTDSEFECSQLGVNYRGKLTLRRTPNPNFLRADAQIFTEEGRPILTLSTVLGR